MIIVKINGGLGNQMFQYAIAKAIAYKTNQSFKLDITAYETYTLHNGYRLNIFNIEENIATQGEIENLKGKDSKFFKLLRKFGFYNKKTYYQEKERTIFDENVFYYENIYLDGYWQNEQYFLNLRNDILNDFDPKEKISSVVNKYLKSINSSNSISIHVRRGDYLKHPEIGVLDISYYKNAVQYIEKNINDTIFFIFSNDIKWCEENFGSIKNKVFIKDTQSEIDDMILMKNCKHNIVANSSFSWWSAWLNDNKDKIIIAPKKWMASNPKNYKWIPSNWIEL